MHVVYFGIWKNYTHLHIKQPTWVVTIGVTKKRPWVRLGTSESSSWRSWQRGKRKKKHTWWQERVKNVTQFLMNQPPHCLEKITQRNSLLWCRVYGRTRILSDKAITGTYTSPERLIRSFCMTSKRVSWRPNQRCKFLANKSPTFLCISL